MSDNREALASLMHDIWSDWMRWQFGLCTFQEDGTAVIPADKVARWQRQMSTPYAELSGPEQDSDRREADKVLAVMRGGGS